MTDPRQTYYDNQLAAMLDADPQLQYLVRGSWWHRYRGTLLAVALSFADGALIALITLNWTGHLR